MITKQFITIVLLSLTLLSLTLSTVKAQSHMPIGKLFRFGQIGSEKPAVVTTTGKSLDVSAFGEDYTETFFATQGIERLQKWLLSHADKCPVVPDGARIAACISRPSKIVAIGLNYDSHAKESGVSVPAEPVIFLKATSALSGPYDPLILPEQAQKVDYEAELAIVIGKKASYVPEDKALDYVAGYTLINDYSERSWQLERDGGQWDKGKSADTFAPLGPYLIPAAQIGNAQNLRIYLRVNGVTMQESNTSDMVYKIAALIANISQYMTLLPGDVIATGTPAGVGLGQKPPRFLKPGDVLELGIEGIGEQKQRVIPFIQSQLTSEEYTDYQNWVALGLGGLPHTLEGYRTVKRMGQQMKDPLDIGRIRADIGARGDVWVLKNLPKRRGNKPTIAPYAVPHRQIDQHNDERTRGLQQKVFDDQVADPAYQLQYKLSYLEKHNPGIFLKDSAAGNPTVVPVSHAEIAHIHQTDGSMHIILSPSDTKEVIEKGWGELHGLSGAEGRVAKTYMMIYAPRTEAELSVTRQILKAAVIYALHQPTP